MPAPVPPLTKGIPEIKEERDHRTHGPTPAPGARARQREVVGHTDGPLLVVAGPGSGKIRCIERRVGNLLLLGETAPDELVLCTFGRDAAVELRERFAASAQACGIAGAASGVRIATIHGLCHRIMAPHAGLAGLRPGFDLLDERDQHRLLHEEFGSILAPDWDVLSRRGWWDEVRAAHEAARYFDRICDESLDPLDLVASEAPFAAALGRCCQRYRELLRDRNAVDFAHLQVWADRALADRGVAAGVGGGVRHLMVDEFQDTSHIQLRILMRLAGVHGNIAVVGDDDQSIDRFRDASVANLVDFPRHFPGCRREVPMGSASGSQGESTTGPGRSVAATSSGMRPSTQKPDYSASQRSTCTSREGRKIPGEV